MLSDAQCSLIEGMLPRSIKAVVPELDDHKGYRKRRRSKGGRPVGLGPAGGENRKAIERRHCHIKQSRGLATRFDKHALVYRAAVILNAMVPWIR